MSKRASKPYITTKPGKSEATNLSDADKLRLIAKWFDGRDERNKNPCDQVQVDLRHIAEFLEKYAQNKLK